MATERLFGGFAGTDIGESLIDFAVKNKALRKTLNFGTEAVEEMIMAGVDPLLQRATGVDKNAEFASLEDYGDAALGGILLSVFMNAATYPIQRNANNESELRDFAGILNAQTETLNELMPDRESIKPLDINNATADDYVCVYGRGQYPLTSIRF